MESPPRSDFLTGRVALVTGASSGIGQAIAVRLAQAGCDLIIHYNENRSGALETAGIASEFGRSTTLLQCDLSNSEHVNRFTEKAWSWRSRLDLLINNAGGDVLTTERKDWSFEEKLDYLWNLDVRSSIRVSRALGERMRNQTLPSLPAIFNIGWDQAELGQAGDSGQMFSTIKGAIMAFTRSLAKSLAPEVRVNCVAPGWIRTSWGESTSEYWNDRAVNESLLKRWGTPEDVANVICFLASDAGEFINGQVIPVNGGIRFGCE